MGVLKNSACNVLGQRASFSMSQFRHFSSYLWSKQVINISALGNGNSREWGCPSQHMNATGAIWKFVLIWITLEREGTRSHWDDSASHKKDTNDAPSHSVICFHPLIWKWPSHLQLRLKVISLSVSQWYINLLFKYLIFILFAICILHFGGSVTSFKNTYI